MSLHCAIPFLDTHLQIVSRAWQAAVAKIVAMELNSCCSIAGRDKVHWVQHVYANFQKNRGKFQSDFPWWQLGDFRSSAIDLANKATLRELCLRLFALERARQVKAPSDSACTAWWRYICWTRSDNFDLQVDRQSLRACQEAFMTPSQPGPEQNPDKSDWESAVVELLDLRLLSSQSVGTLLATSRQLRNHVHDNSTSLKLRKRVDVDLLVRQRGPRLAKLALCKTGWPTAAAAAQGPWHAVQKLDFRRGGLDLLDVQHLAGSMLPQLTRLGLRSCGAGPGTCKALVNGHWPHLAAPNLYGNSLGPNDVQDLVQGHLPSLASLNLGNNELKVGRQASTKHWEFCKWPHLTKLQVHKCCLSVADIECIVRVHWPLLAHLDVRKNGLNYTYLCSIQQATYRSCESCCRSGVYQIEISRGALLKDTGQSF